LEYDYSRYDYKKRIPRKVKQDNKVGGFSPSSSPCLNKKGKTMAIKESNYDENNLKAYKIVVKFDATNEDDAEDFVNDMNPGDWLEHLEEEKE
tara:strand:- start:269 stop:547 length:279 start_codon:yes stop_codon:yes gene_type:complete